MSTSSSMEGIHRQVWFIPIADERVGVQIKLWDPLRTRAIPERFCGCVSLWRGAILSACTFTFTLPLLCLHGDGWTEISSYRYCNSDQHLVFLPSPCIQTPSFRHFKADDGNANRKRCQGRWNTTLHVGVGPTWFRKESEHQLVMFWNRWQRQNEGRVLEREVQVDFEKDCYVEWYRRRSVKVKVKVHTLDIAPLRSESPPQKRSGMARVLEGFHTFTCTPRRSSAIRMSHTCLCLPIRSWYSLTDPGWMEGWVDGAK